MIDVAAAILHNDKNEILIAKRKLEKSQGGLWEFPGGKVEAGEKPEESLVRELKEEMNFDIKVDEYFGENVHQYESFSIRLIAYTGEVIGGELHLKDHDEIAWLEIKELRNFGFAPADIPLVEKLIRK